MKPEIVREEFEKWAETYGMSVMRRHSEYGYIESYTNHMWLAWHAAYAALTTTDEYKALVKNAEAHRARMAFISTNQKELLPDYGDRLPLHETLPSSDGGSAYWATDTHYYPRATERPDDATQILYFSK